MKHTTTPYYEPKIFKTPAPELKKKHFPWIHFVIGLLVVATFIGIAIYNLANKADFISNGGTQAILFAGQQIATICLLLFSGFLLAKRQWVFVLPFLGTFVIGFVLEPIFIFWTLPETPEQLMALFTVEKITQLGVALIVVILTIPLLGSLSDKLKLYITHRELFEG